MNKWYISDPTLNWPALLTTMDFLITAIILFAVCFISTIASTFCIIVTIIIAACTRNVISVIPTFISTVIWSISTSGTWSFYRDTSRPTHPGLNFFLPTWKLESTLWTQKKYYTGPSHSFLVTKSCSDWTNTQQKVSCIISKSMLYNIQSERLFGWMVGCLTSQQHASVSQGCSCSDKFTCCHTEIEVADQTLYLTQSQYNDRGPISPSADPIKPGAWQGSHWSANF